MSGQIEYDAIEQHDQLYCAAFNTYCLPILFALGVRDATAILRWGRRMDFGQLFAEIVDAFVRQGIPRNIAEANTDKIICSHRHPDYFDVKPSTCYIKANPNDGSAPEGSRLTMWARPYYRHALCVEGGRLTVDHDVITRIHADAESGARALIMREAADFLEMVNSAFNGAVPDLRTMFLLIGNKWEVSSKINFI